METVQQSYIKSLYLPRCAEGEVAMMMLYMCNVYANVCTCTCMCTGACHKNIVVCVHTFTVVVNKKLTFFSVKTIVRAYYALVLAPYHVR